MAQEQIIAWHVATHEHKERGADWYWTLGLVALVGAGISVFFGNFLFGIILLVGAASIGFLAARGPREHEVRLDSRGISIDGTFYRYSSVSSFWINEKPGEPMFFVSVGGLLTPHFSLPLDNPARGPAVRAFLNGRVEEIEQGQHMSEHLAQFFGL